MAARHIFFEITDICNEDCCHCDKKWRADGGHTMSTEMLDKILAIPKDFMVISGGEPALAKEQVRYIAERSTAPVSMNTNLTLWSQEDIAWLNNARIGLSVSVVSLNRETYKKITGKDLVHRLKANLDMINRDNRMTIIVNNENMDELESMVCYLTVRGFHRFIIQPAIPGMGDEFNYGQYLKRLTALKNTYRKHRNIDIKCMCYYDSSYGDLPVDHKCEAGQKRLVILSNGDVVPCACMPPIVLGNIMHDTWDNIQAAGGRYFESFTGHDKIMCKGFLMDKAAYKNKRV